MAHFCIIYIVSFFGYGIKAQQIPVRIVLIPGIAFALAPAVTGLSMNAAGAGFRDFPNGLLFSVNGFQ